MEQDESGLYLAVLLAQTPNLDLSYSDIHLYEVGTGQLKSTIDLGFSAKSI